MLSTVLPVLIPMFTILLNKPKFYMKFIYFKLKKKDIEFKYSIKLEGLDIEKEVDYDKFIRLVEDEYRSRKSQVKSLSHNVGEFIGKSVIMINTVEHTFYYNFEDNSLLIHIESTSSYKNFFIIIEKLTKVLNDIFSKSRKIGYDDSKLSLTIKFINDETYNLSNPMFKNIYSEFSPRLVKLNYDVNDTNIELTNDSIILTSKDFTDINDSLKNQFKFFYFSK